MCTNSCRLKANINCGTDIVINTPGVIGDKYTVSIVDALDNYIETVAECTTNPNEFIIPEASLPAGFLTKHKEFMIKFFEYNTVNRANIKLQTFNNEVHVVLDNQHDQIGVPYA
jgi:hypothetical protein